MSVPHRRTPLRPCRRAFTLVEMLMVLGIIVLLMSILVPTIMGSRKKARIARIQQDIQSIGVALESYQQTWNTYPVFDATAPNFTINPDGQKISIKDGAVALYAALATRSRIRAGGTPYGPFINVEQFKSGPNFFGAMQIQDQDGHTYAYIPANPVRPDIRSLLKNGKFSLADAWKSGPAPLYDQTAFPTKLAANDPTPNAISIADMLQLLGDKNKNGFIDAGEQVAYTGPFLLWHIGADNIWGLQTSGGKTTTDDITNFEIPSDYRR